jgi:hypothetical protein
MLFGVTACSLRHVTSETCRELRNVYQVGVDPLMYHDARSTKHQSHGLFSRLCLEQWRL